MSDSESVSVGDGTVPLNEEEQRILQGDSLAQHILIGLTANMQVMATNVATMASTMKNLGISFKEDHRRNSWRWVTTLVMVAVLIFAVYINREGLQILQKATGTEAQKAQAAGQANALRQIDCDGEVNIIIYTANLTKALPQVPIPELSPQCQIFYKTHPQLLDTPVPTTTP